MKTINFETLLELDDGDFSFWKEKEYDMTFYKLAIEGYIGFEDPYTFVEVYTTWLNKLHEYLVQNDYTEPAPSSWKTVYRSRAIDIRNTGGCYWIFLDTYESTEAWRVYDYLKDVIRHLKEWCRDRVE